MSPAHYKLSNPDFLDKRACGDISAKQYCMFRETFKVKCPASGAKSVFDQKHGCDSGNYIACCMYQVSY